MKRNWDVIRKILLKVEALPTEDSSLNSSDLNSEGIDSETGAYHMRLLIEAGMVKGVCNNAIMGPAICIAKSLTWSGHEFLDGIKRETVWNKVKETAREKGLDLSIDVIKAAAKAIVSQLLS